MVYNYRRRVQLLPLLPMTSVNHYRRPEDVGFVKYLSETNVYNYFLYDRYENVYFHYRRENDYFHDDPANNYFHFERVPPRMHASKV